MTFGKPSPDIEPPFAERRRPNWDDPMLRRRMANPSISSLGPWPATFGFALGRVLAARRDHCALLDHQHHHPALRPGEMHLAARDGDALARLQPHGAVLGLDHQHAFE